jgi:predicted permease
VGFASLVSRVPIGQLGADCMVAPVEWAADTAKRVGADYRTATPGYFHTLGIPMVAGRVFDAGDRANAPPVAIINKRLAHELFGNGNAIGRRVVGCGASATPSQVVGVSEDIHADGLAEDVSDQVYVPSAQFPERGMTLLVRGNVPVLTLLPSVRRAVTGADPMLPLSRPTTMAAVMSQTLATSRFQSALLAMFGVCGLLLAGIGIYGLVAFLVAQRTVEIGIRMALGASKGEVFAMIAREGLRLAGVGIATGVVIAFAAGRAIGRLLFEIGAHDLLTFTAVAVLLIVVALAASVVPARRATQVDPLVAMRAG